jgi:Family of unknown function (DUF6714)
MTDNEIYLVIKKTFADAPRPEHFTNRNHCEECQEHDDLLRNKDVDNLSYADIGNPGWSPVPFMTAEAIRYYFPALVRVAFDPNHKGNPLNFVGALLSNLNSDDMKRFALFSSEERKAVLMLLSHLKGSLSERFGFDEDESAELEPLIVKWTKFSAEN